MCDNLQVPKLRKKTWFFLVLMKNAVVTPLEVDQFGQKFYLEVLHIKYYLHVKFRQNRSA